MKVTKKSVSVQGPFISSGSRGVVVNDLKELVAPLTIGKQPILEKRRGENHAATELWNKSCSWITSRKAVSKNGQAEFTIDTLAHAIRTKAVRAHTCKFRSPDGKMFTAQVVSLPDWDPSMKQPFYLGVVKAAGYKYNRIESTLIREADGSASRNKHLVCKLVR